MKNNLLLLLGLTALAPMSGEVLGARALPPGAAPARGLEAGPAPTPAPVAVSRRFVEWDGFTVTKLVLTFGRGAAIEISQQRMGDWQRRDRAPFAIAFFHPLAPEAVIGINSFTGPAAASLLTGTAWSVAPGSLPRHARDVSRVLVNDDSAANTNMLRPLSGRTRVFEREITSPEPGATPQRQVLVAVGDDSRAYLFTLEGPATQVTQLKENFGRFVTAFELVP